MVGQKRMISVIAVVSRIGNHSLPGSGAELEVVMYPTGMMGIIN